MTTKKNPPAATMPATTEKPAATAAKAAAPKPAAAKPAAKALAKPVVKPRVRKAPSAAAAQAETDAKNQQALAEALTKAKALKIPQPVGQPLPPPPLPGKSKKGAKEKVVKPARKVKLVRDSYAMPETEYARIGGLKKRFAALGQEVKKSELLRAGIALLAEMQDADLKAAMAKVERIKTGRPAKHK